MLKLSLVPFLLIASAPAVRSQALQAPPDREPEIAATGRGEVRLAPDYAYVTIGVRTQSPSAVETASQNTAKVAAVIAALRSLGLTQQQLATSGYALEQTYYYPKNGEPRPTGFVARNTIRAEVRRLDDLGKVIDAAINAGATDVSSIQFLATNTDDARRTALADAVKQARMDADVIARAAGGSLGRLLAVNFTSTQPILLRGAMLETAVVTSAGGGMPSMPTPVNPGELNVIAQVFTRWQFVSGAGR
ncbi:MAG TPA: SIMPL domain-containing protein [Gemmatimonadaceae bacterium]|nr:SIMPL domain-containing protein [Gemmatimonadaceae bacterium]